MCNRAVDGVGEIPRDYHEPRAGGISIYAPQAQPEASHQMYHRGYDPYAVDDLSAAAAALSLGGGPNLPQDNSAMFPHSVLHRQQLRQVLLVRKRFNYHSLELNSDSELQRVPIHFSSHWEKGC